MGFPGCATEALEHQIRKQMRSACDHEVRGNGLGRGEAQCAEPRGRTSGKSHGRGTGTRRIQRFQQGCQAQKAKSTKPAQTRSKSGGGREGGSPESWPRGCQATNTTGVGPRRPKGGKTRAFCRLAVSHSHRGRRPSSPATASARCGLARPGRAAQGRVHVPPAA